MKRLNRRSKQKSISGSSSPSPSIASGNKVKLDKRIRDMELQSEAPKKDIVELRNEIQRLKVQKVQLQCKMKLESMQFRIRKASLEKEILQLKKEQRRDKYEKHVLSNLNQRQKHVLQRKTQEAFMAVKSLKELIESKKAASGKIAGARNDSKIAAQGIEHDIEVKMKLDEVCWRYEHRIEKMADEIKKLKLELEMLREEKSRSQDNEAAIDDSELIDLREEVAKLSCMVSQMNMTKALHAQAEGSQVDMVQTSVSIGSNIHASDMDTPESEQSEGTIGMTKKSSGVCCSCSKKSLCKTLKCECRAGGSSCGMSCGCAIAKCTNREKVPFKLDDMPQPAKAADIVPDDIKKQKFLVEDFIPDEIKVVEKPPEMNVDCEPRKQPLGDIGNVMIKPVAGKPGPRKKGQKAIVQPDTMDPPQPFLENTKVTRTNKILG